MDFITNGTAAAVTIDSATIEILAVNEVQPPASRGKHLRLPWKPATGGPTRLHSQVDYLTNLRCSFYVPILARRAGGTGETFESYVTFEILHDSGDRTPRLVRPPHA